MDLLATHQLPALKSLDGAALARIQAGMLEHARAISAFGRSNSQTTAKMMSLTMLSEGPYRRLRQCLAEIDKRRAALNEAAINLRKKQAQLKWLGHNLPDSLERDLAEIEADELRWQISETQRVAEGSLKDIAALQDAYEQIRAAHNIPEKWDEADFEAAEVRAHLLSAFRLAFSDMLERGALSRSAIEYLAQFGVHPYTAQTVIRDYLAELEGLRAANKLPQIEHFYQWLDDAAGTFGAAYQSAMARVGLTSLVTEWCQYREALS